MKEKIKKYKKFDFSETSIEDFIKVYEQQNYFNSNLKLNLKFKNIKIFKIKNNFGASYAVLGISKNTIEYLLACSSKKSKDLQSVLIFQLLNYFYNKASIFNLGGGIIPGDGIEKFKSFFNSQFKQQEVIQIVLNKIKFNQVLERQKKVNFFPPYASKSIVKKYF